MHGCNVHISLHAQQLEVQYLPMNPPSVMDQMILASTGGCHFTFSAAWKRSAAERHSIVSGNCLSVRFPKNHKPDEQRHEYTMPLPILHVSTEHKQSTLNSGTESPGL